MLLHTNTQLSQQCLLKSLPLPPTLSTVVERHLVVDIRLPSRLSDLLQCLHLSLFFFKANPMLFDGYNFAPYSKVKCNASCSILFA